MGRIELLAERDRLRQARGVATLDAGAFDDAAIDAVEREIARQEDAESERVRRERAGAEAAHAAFQAKQRAAVAKADRERREALADAQTAARALVGSLAVFMAETTALGDAVRKLEADPPLSLDPHVVRDRLGHFLGEAFAPISPSRRLGAIHWPVPPFPIADWLNAERGATAAAIAQLTEPEGIAT